MDDEFLNEMKESFLADACDLLRQAEENLLALDKNPDDKSIIDEMFRLAHNLKGSAQIVGFDELSNFSHHIENLLAKLKNNELNVTAVVIDILLKCTDQLNQNVTQLKDDFQAETDNRSLIIEINNIMTAGDKEEIEQLEMEIKELKEEQEEENIIAHDQIHQQPDQNNHPSSDNTPSDSSNNSKNDEYIRISLSKIDNLLNCFGEQVILQSLLDHAKEDIMVNQDVIIQTISQLNKITHDLQQTAFALRMLPIKNMFYKMERIVRDVSKELDKKIKFHISGENNELDKTIIEAITAPLTHMIRNAVDHGIETPPERISAGKTDTGNIHLSAYCKSGYFYIVVKDDGKGLDKNKILNTAKKRGIISENQTLSDYEIYNLIFKSGLSTKEQVSQISGRGVGMDVVNTAITNLNGTCEFQSSPGEGSTFIIRLPLTLAIFNGMIVQIQKDKFIFPNSDIEEAVPINQEDIKRIDKNDSVVEIKNTVIPLINVGRIINKKPLKKMDENNSGIGLIVKHDNKKYALLVDDILFQQRIVHKKLGDEIRDIPGVVGGTILGDGSVALIIESSGIIDYHKKIA